MKNQIYKLIIISSCFSFILTGYESKFSQGKTQNESPTQPNTSANFQKLYNDINTSYQQLAKNFQEESQLLTKLKEESQKSTPPTSIEIIDVKITDDLNRLITAIKNLQAQVSDNEKETLQSLLSLIQKQSPSLESIIGLFEDGKLEKTEICENIQKPLEVENLNDSNCGNFGQKTYETLNLFLNAQNQLIETEIKNIGSLPSLSNQSPPPSNPPLSNPPQSSTNNNQFLILIIINSVLGLGLIILAILWYLSIINLQQKNLELLDKNKRRKIQITELENREINRGQQITKLDSRIKELKQSLDNQSLIIASLMASHGNNNLSVINQSSQELKEVSSQENQAINEETPPPPMSISEDVRLLNLYKENPQDLFQNAIRVSMTKDTINKVLAGTWEGLVELEMNNRQGEFYIISNDNEEFYLFLDPNTKFNLQTLQNINKSQLFIFNGNLSQSFKGSELNIIKPAIVIQYNQIWRLIQSGEIELII